MKKAALLHSQRFKFNFFLLRAKNPEPAATWLSTIIWAMFEPWASNSGTPLLTPKAVGWACWYFARPVADCALATNGLAGLRNNVGGVWGWWSTTAAFCCCRTKRLPIWPLARCVFVW